MRKLLIKGLWVGLIIALAIACSVGQDQVIGKWVEKNNGEWEFFSDKTFVIPGWSGTWVILNDGRVKLSFNIGGTLILTLKGDTMSGISDGQKMFIMQGKTIFLKKKK